MRPIRSLLYRLGFRPKPGSIFYSPSISLRLSAQEALDTMTRRMYDLYQRRTFVEYLKWGDGPIPLNGRYYSRADEYAGNVPKED